MSLYSVMTFLHAKEGRKPFAVSYLRDASPNWGGCITYDVNAENGKEAKKIAERMRREHEETKDADHA